MYGASCELWLKSPSIMLLSKDHAKFALKVINVVSNKPALDSGSYINLDGISRKRLIPAQIEKGLFSEELCNALHDF